MIGKEKSDTDGVRSACTDRAGAGVRNSGGWTMSYLQPKGKGMASWAPRACGMKDSTFSEVNEEQTCERGV